MFEVIKASDEVFEKRMSICRGCEFVRVLPVVGEQCSVCNCVMALKARIKITACPKDKWKAEEL